VRERVEQEVRLDLRLEHLQRASAACSSIRAESTAHRATAAA
jgi:hypothetical protein